MLLSLVASTQASLFGVAGDYNAFIFNDLAAVGGDTEGRLAVGHNATMSNYSVGSRIDNSYGALDALVVGHDLNAIGKWQVFNGNAVYGNTLVQAPSIVAPNAIRQDSPIDFAAVALSMQLLSSHLANLPENGSSQYQWSTLTITGTDPTLNVVTIDAGEWAKADDRQIIAPAGSTLIINIPGTSNSMQGGLSLSGVDRAHVLYNFYESTSITSNHIAVMGSVLAPYASATINGGAFEGNAILLNATQTNGGEFHYYPFTGTPEPATMGLWLIGALAFLRRTRGA
ncbi:MAG: choice-of-anchor A family protein [Phycisphaerales bacterium]|nr:choice-of-anchor A family protein [Phycisphaerales bacterium]